MRTMIFLLTVFLFLPQAWAQASSDLGLTFKGTWEDVFAEDTFAPKQIDADGNVTRVA